MNRVAKNQKDDVVLVAVRCKRGDLFLQHLEHLHSKLGIENTSEVIRFCVASAFKRTK